MRNVIGITLLFLLTPMLVNDQFNIDNRLYMLEGELSFGSPITSFYDNYELLDSEIVVNQEEVKDISTAKPNTPKVTVRKQNELKTVSFKSFRSSFKGIANYWPTKKANPLAKKEVKLESLVKLEIPKPVVVKKYEINKLAIEEIDKKLAFSFATENDFITTQKEVSGKIMKVKVSLLTMEINNHLEAKALEVIPSMPRLAVEGFSQKEIDQRLAFLDEDEELDRLITEYKKDKVKLSQSSVKKSYKEDAKASDDLVFISLDNKEKKPSGPIEPLSTQNQLAKKLIGENLVTTQKVENLAAASPTKTQLGSPVVISNSVTKAIKRSMNSVRPQTSQLLASMGKSFKTPTKNIPDINNLISSLHKKPELAQESLSTSPFATVRPLLISLDGKFKTKSLYEFDVIPSYDLNDLFTDAGSGKVKIEYPINSEKALFHGSIVHRDTVRVNFDLPLGTEQNDYSMPVFDLTEFNEFINKNKAAVPGGFLLVEYSEGIDSVDIEKYEKVLHLNSKFEVIDDKKQPEYSIFVGVDAGNILLRALNQKGEISEKVIFVYDDELTFTTTHFEKSTKLNFKLFRENLLGRKSVLSLDQKNVNYFNLPITSEQKTVNGYSLKAPPLMEGMRRYLEVNTISGVYIIGTDKGGDLSIPTDKTLDFYLSEVNLEDFDNSCVVQLNTSKPIESFRADGVTNRGPMLLDTHYLNDYGQLYKAIDGPVRKVFLTGDYQGSIYFLLKYVDGTQEVSRTYCSPGTYVIENF